MVEGYGFPLIPENAWVILSDDNDNPLKYANVSANDYRMIIHDKTATSMRMEQFFGTLNLGPSYLGAILTPDRTEVIWVNDTKPLP